MTESEKELVELVPIPNGVRSAWAEAGYTPVDSKRQTEADSQSLLTVLPQRGVRARLPSQLFEGNCIEEIKKIPSKTVRLILTDPPFFQPAEAYSTRSDSKFRYFSNNLADFGILGGFFSGLIPEFKRVLTNDGRVLMFCDAVSYPIFYSVFYGQFEQVRAVIWYKGKNHFPIGTGQAFRYSYEMLLHAWSHDSYYSKGNRQDVLECRVVPIEDRIHPAEKPRKLLRQLIMAVTEPGDVILDCFAGSGATLEACFDLNRSCLAIELDPTFAKKIRFKLDSWNHTNTRDNR